MSVRQSIEDFARVEATCDGVPVYAFGYTYVYGVSPDFSPDLSWQVGAKPGEKIIPKKSWEIGNNLSVRIVPHKEGLCGYAPMPWQRTDGTLLVGQALAKRLTVKLSRDGHHWETVFETKELVSRPTDNLKNSGAEGPGSQGACASRTGGVRRAKATRRDGIEGKNRTG